jgi:uncharacterized protein YecE (DUF72 family)
VKLTMQLKVGLCGWTISMSEYFERFPVVEVQQTFYEPPPPRTLLRWREAAPEGFEFTLKAWQLITHEATSSTYKRLRTPLSPAERAECGRFRWNDTVKRGWDITVQSARVLHATSVLFQCPASFRPTDDNLAQLRRFFTDTDRHGLRFLWEPRGPAWTAEIVQPLCESLELVHVVDPLVNRSTTPQFIYFRLHGIGNHRHVYTEAELASVAAMLTPGAPSYVMFNNIPRDNDSARFEALMRARERTTR